MAAGSAEIPGDSAEDSAALEEVSQEEEERLEDGNKFK